MHAIVRNGVPHAIVPSPREFIVGQDGTKYSQRITSMWTPDQLAAVGIYEVIDDAVPQGKTWTAYTLEFTGSSVLRHFTLTDIPPPSSVTRYQLKAALDDLGKTAAAVGAINSATARLKLAWSEKPEIGRQSALIAHLKDRLSMTDAEVDSLFRAAAQIGD